MQSTEHAFEFDVSKKTAKAICIWKVYIRNDKSNLNIYIYFQLETQHI